MDEASGGDCARFVRDQLERDNLPETDSHSVRTRLRTALRKFAVFGVRISMHYAHVTSESFARSLCGGLGDGGLVCAGR